MICKFIILDISIKMDAVEVEHYNTIGMTDNKT